MTLKAKAKTRAPPKETASIFGEGEDWSTSFYLIQQQSSLSGSSAPRTMLTEFSRAFPFKMTINQLTTTASKTCHYKPGKYYYFITTNTKIPII